MTFHLNWNTVGSVNIVSSHVLSRDFPIVVTRNRRLWELCLRSALHICRLTSLINWLITKKCILSAYRWAGHWRPGRRWNSWTAVEWSVPAWRIVERWGCRRSSLDWRLRQVPRAPPSARAPGQLADQPYPAESSSPTRTQAPRRSRRCSTTSSVNPPRPPWSTDYRSSDHVSAKVESCAWVLVLLVKSWSVVLYIKPTVVGTTSCQ